MSQKLGKNTQLHCTPKLVQMLIFKLNHGPNKIGEERERERERLTVVIQLEMELTLYICVRGTKAELEHGHIDLVGVPREETTMSVCLWFLPVAH